MLKPSSLLMQNCALLLPRACEWCDSCSFSLWYCSLWLGHSMNPFIQVSDTVWGSEMFLAPHVDQATEPSLFTWAEFLPGSCADPSAVRLLADLPYRMSKQAENVQSKSSSLGPFLALPPHWQRFCSPAAFLPASSRSSSSCLWTHRDFWSGSLSSVWNLFQTPTPSECKYRRTLVRRDELYILEKLENILIISKDDADLYMDFRTENAEGQFLISDYRSTVLSAILKSQKLWKLKVFS